MPSTPARRSPGACRTTERRISSRSSRSSGMTATSQRSSPSSEVRRSSTRSLSRTSSPLWRTSSGSARRACNSALASATASLLFCGRCSTCTTRTETATSKNASSRICSKRCAFPSKRRRNGTMPSSFWATPTAPPSPQVFRMSSCPSKTTAITRRSPLLISSTCAASCSASLKRMRSSTWRAFWKRRISVRKRRQSSAIYSTFGPVGGKCAKRRRAGIRSRGRRRAMDHQARHREAPEQWCCPTRRGTRMMP
mmetsp:Transcript_87950/g.247105  ORF Transcript_87950/g.247105 Transcript_87950/m.247105 type:complete len:253 (+) Transcript_87950:2241-2999(+)